MVDSTDDLDKSVSFFQESLISIFNGCFPQRTVRLRSTDPPWLKPSLKILIDDRDKAYHKHQMAKYFRLRNEVISHCKHLKQFFIKSSSSRSTVSSSGSRLLWNALRNVGGLSKARVCLPFSAENLNEYFASNFQASTALKRIPEVCDESSICVTPGEVRGELLRLQRRSSGPDGLPFWVFRRSADSLSPAISVIFNRSFRQNSFSKQLQGRERKPHS